MGDFYINGVNYQTAGTAPTGDIIAGGTLVLGLDQDKVGGGFKDPEWFIGEMYNLNVYKKKLSLEEVAGMFYSGRCADIPRPLTYDIILRWGDIMKAERYGTITAFDVGCNRCQRDSQ